MDILTVGKAVYKASQTVASILQQRQAKKLKEALRAVYNEDPTDEQVAQIEALLFEDPKAADWVHMLFFEEDVAKSWAYGLILRAYRDRQFEDLMAWAQFVRDVRSSDLDALRTNADSFAQFAHETQLSDDQLRAFNDYIGRLQLASPRLIGALVSGGFLIVESRPPIDFDALFASVYTDGEFRGPGKVEMGDWKRPTQRLLQLLRMLELLKSGA